LSLSVHFTFFSFIPPFPALFTFLWPYFLFVRIPLEIADHLMLWTKERPTICFEPPTGNNYHVGMKLGKFGSE